MTDHDQEPGEEHAGIATRRALRDWQRSVGARRAIESLEAEHARSRSAVEVAADQLTRWASSTVFFVAHVVWFAAWLAWNSGRLGLRPFDPYPFGLLTMVVSLEAIFLTLCVLMAQGRESDVAELREEVTLQVLLRTESEVTKVMQLVASMSSDPDALWADDAELRDMLQPLDAHEIEHELTAQIVRARHRSAAVAAAALAAASHPAAR
jgi:uncharacterized membrane protein